MRLVIGVRRERMGRIRRVWSYFVAMFCSLLCFFFFQAEDGIRDHCVTGVQTCALPICTTSLGKLTFPLVLEYVDDMLTVTDDELLRAMFFLWERMKIIVEPTGALAACALLEKKLDARALSGRRVGVILSGGNVDLRWAAARLQARP